MRKRRAFSPSRGRSHRSQSRALELVGAVTQGSTVGRSSFATRSATRMRVETGADAVKPPSPPAQVRQRVVEVLEPV